jgi:hypothetical protein
MKKLLIITLLIVGCEETLEPQDCAGVAGGVDYGSQCLDGSYECNLDDCPAPTATEIAGTYTMSSTTLHSDGDCSVDNGTSGICFPGQGISEAECPVGDCNCGVNLPDIANEEACDAVDGDWDGVGCEGDCDVTTETECLAADGEWYSGGFCMDMEKGDSIDCGADITTAGNCTAAGGEWLMNDENDSYECDDVDCEQADCSGDGLAWIVFGWNLLADTYTNGWAVTIDDDGTFIAWHGQTGTWTLDGTTLTTTDTGDTSQEGQIQIFEVTGTSIIMITNEEAHCGDCSENDPCDGTDETTCESTGGDWVGAECIELIFTK